MSGHVAVLTNQMLVYKHHRVIPTTVIPRRESVAKMSKLNPKINLGIPFDFGITNPRFILRFKNRALVTEVMIPNAES